MCLFVFCSHICVCAPVIKAKYWSKGLCRLRPEPHNELELIRARDWGRWIISLFRLAPLPKHQRHAAQYDRIIVTEKPKASLFISRVQCTREGLLMMMMSWQRTPPHRPTDAGRTKYLVKYTVCDVLCLAFLSMLFKCTAHTQRATGCVLSVPCQQDYFLWAMM